MPGSALLCEECLLLLELIEPEERCFYCFSPNISPKWKICSRCSHQSHYLSGFASAFDTIGPPHDLVRHLKNGKHYLAHGLAGFLALQWTRLNWPQPDLIVPVAGSFSRWIQRGYNPRALLAKELSTLLNTSFLHALRRCSYQTDTPRFKVRRGVELQDLTILLVDDVFASGETIDAAAQALLSSYPAKVYGLTVCKVIKSCI
jgi:competence protein ComFC